MNKSLRESLPKLLLLVNVALGILICAALIFLSRQVVTGFLADSPAGKAAPPARPTEQAPRKALEDYSAIVKNNPFGMPPGDLTRLSDGKVTATPAGDLRLLGTMAGPRHLSYAILADKTSRQEVFKVGERVFDSGTLSRVEKERVFIESNGQRVEIAFAEAGAAADPGPRPQAAVPSGSFSPQSVISSGKGSYIVDQRAILQAIEKPQQLMTDARLQPNLSSGKQEGFILREVKNNGIYHILGLKNNDILLRINNFDITGPETALQAFSALRGMDRVALDIVRDGAKMTLTYQIR